MTKLGGRKGQGEYFFRKGKEVFLLFFRLGIAVRPLLENRVTRLCVPYHCAPFLVFKTGITLDELRVVEEGTGCDKRYACM